MCAINNAPLFVIACMQHLMARRPKDNVREEVLWADVGTHFRAYRLWVWWLDALPKERGVNTALHYHPEGHGKHMLDGLP